MFENLKLILNGMSVRFLAEGAMSDIHIEFTEWIDDLRYRVKSSGDFKYIDLVDNVVLKQEFDYFISEFEKYNIVLRSFIENQIKLNKDISFIEMLDKIQEKFL